MAGATGPVGTVLPLFKSGPRLVMLNRTTLFLRSEEYISRYGSSKVQA